MHNYLSAAEIIERLGIRYQTLRRWVKAGSFPAAVRLGQRKVAWREEDVRAWEASRPRVGAARHAG